MRKGFKKLVIFGGLVLAGVIVYRKTKNSDEENFVKEVSNTIKEKVDETMKEADVKEFLDKKAKKIVNDISFGKTMERLGDRFVTNLIHKTRKTIFKKVTSYAFFSELLE